MPMASDTLGPTSNQSFSPGLVSTRSVGQLQREDERLRKEKEKQKDSPISNAASMFWKRWQKAKDAKTTINQQLLRNQMQRKGEYPTEKLAAIRAAGGGSTAFVRLTETKAWSLENWIGDILFSQKQRIWQLAASENPELPEEVVQQIVEMVVGQFQQRLMSGEVVDPWMMQDEAADVRDEIMEEIRDKSKKSAKRMESKILDQFQQGGFNAALRQFIQNYATYTNGFLKGPVWRDKPRLKYINGKATIVNEVRPEWEAPSPFDIYPGEGATDCQDADLFEVMAIDRRYLAACRGAPGFNADAINYVISQNAAGVNPGNPQLDFESARRAIENRTNESSNPPDRIYVIDGYMSLPGWTLVEWGIKVEDLNAEYEVNGWMAADGTLVRLVINDDMLHRRPYFMASFRPVAGSFWGEALADVIRPEQDDVNAAERTKQNNEAIASGPFIWYDKSRLPAGMSLTRLAPWMLVPFENDMAGGAPPVYFHQVESLVAEMIAVIADAKKSADDNSGIPAYAHGDPDVGGAGNTKGGLMMMMSSAGRGIKQSVAQIFENVIIPAIRHMFDCNMRYNPDPELMGDVEVVPAGLMVLFMKDEAGAMTAELLNLSNNPTDIQIFGIEGRRKMWEAHVENRDMDIHKLVPTEEALKQRLLLAQQAQMQEEQAAAMQEQQPAQK